MTSLIRLPALCLVLGAAACAPSYDAPMPSVRNDETLNVIDESDLNELILTVSNADDAVSYFRKSLEKEPGRVEFKRGLALSLARARKHVEAVEVFEELSTAGQADDEIRIEYAYSLTRLERWSEAEAQMAQVGSSSDEPRRFLIDAILADHRGDWAAADLAYEEARRLSANPARILNNWGVSRMSRGEYAAAEETFRRALAHDPRLFNAKNNLAVSRALQGEYRVPAVTLTEEERATLLHNIGVIALRRGDLNEAKGLFTMAVAAHPQYYAPAAEKLAALESGVVN